jgi:hypothetical protein
VSPRMMRVLARVDGLPVEKIKPERIWPIPGRPSGGARRSRERVARQTMAVHHARTPRWALPLLTEPADLDVHAELAAAGLL